MDVCFDEIIYNNIFFLLRLSNLFDLKHLHMTNMQKNQQKNERNQEKGKYVFFSTVAEFISRCYVAKTNTHTYHLASLEKKLYHHGYLYSVFSSCENCFVLFCFVIFGFFFLTGQRLSQSTFLEEAHFFHLYPRSCFFSHYPKYMIIIEARRIDQSVKSTVESLIEVHKNM